jgi:lipopolysaccharide transport system permease protein
MNITQKSIRFYELLITLAKKDLTVKYKNTFLGYLWSIGHPLALATVYYIAFKYVMRIQIDNYALFLVTGLFAWQWFANSSMSSVNVFLTNSTIIKKVKFENYILPMSIVVIDMFHFVVSIPVIMLFLYMHDFKFIYASWLYQIPLVLFVNFIFIYAVTLILGAVNLFFRDMERIVSILIMMLFYLTPVLYPIDFVPEKYINIFMLNPMAEFIELWRNVFISGELKLEFLGVSAVHAVVMLGVAIAVYRRLSYKFAEVV